MTTTERRTNGSGTQRDGGEGGRAAHAPQQIRESVRALQRDTRELFGAIEQLSTSVGDALREQLDRRPYATLGAGFVAGYVLGGGLSLRLATLLGAAAARTAMMQLVSQSVDSAARGGRE